MQATGTTEPKSVRAELQEMQEDTVETGPNSRSQGGKNKADRKSFVLINRRTGQLMEGYRVCFIDQDWASDLLIDRQTYQIGLLQHEGWIVVTDKFPPFYMNHQAEGFIFDVLGEL